MDITQWYTTIEATGVLQKGDKWLRDNWKRYKIERVIRGHTAFYNRADIDRLAAELKAKEDGG